MFKLNFTPPPSSTKLSIKDSIYLIGSCFSDEIGGKLQAYKFDALSNPFGTIYNPLSIFHLLAGDMKEDDIVESQEIYYHWDCHGAIAGSTETELREQLIQKKEESNSFVRSANWLIITFGTAYVYELKGSGKVVANCHKVAADQFTKRLLTSQEIEEAFDSVFAKLKASNPDLNILLTVSPVRHIKDGLIENNRSKSTLLTSAHNLVDKYDSVHYFPSYEIVIDELRDYRFYQEDLVHPSEQAVNYIWHAFVEACCEEETVSFIQDWKKLLANLSHRPFLPNSERHQSFLKKTLAKLETLKETIDVEKEISTVRAQII